MFLVYKNYTFRFFRSIYSFIDSRLLFKKYSNVFSVVIFLDLWTRVYCCVTKNSFCSFAIDIRRFVKLITNWNTYNYRPTILLLIQSFNSFLVIRNNLFAFNCARHDHFNQTKYLQTSLCKRGCIVRCWRQCRSYSCTSV